MTEPAPDLQICFLALYRVARPLYHALWAALPGLSWKESQDLHAAIEEEAPDLFFAGPAGATTERALVVAALLADSPEMVEAADFAYRHGLLLVPLLAAANGFSLGPYVARGRSACYHCRLVRERQHGSRDKETLAVTTCYAAHPELHPHCYLAPFAHLAATQIASSLSTAEQRDRWMGRLWFVNQFTGDTRTSTIVGVDGCPVCGMDRNNETRSYRDLRQAFLTLRQAPADSDRT